jgi:RNA polymerase sigma-70 factor (ECF subfamily)
MEALATFPGSDAGAADVQGLYAVHAPALRAALRRLTDGRADAEDLLQETFVIALGQPQRLLRADSPRAWLYGIAVKVAAGHRRRAWFKGLLGLEAARDAAHAGRGPEAAAQQRQAERLVQRALEVLSPKKREVFVLFELEGLSGPEIAAAVGCPLKTVWTRLFHARREFAARLQALTGAEP